MSERQTASSNSKTQKKEKSNSTIGPTMILACYFPLLSLIGWSAFGITFLYNQFPEKDLLCYVTIGSAIVLIALFVGFCIKKHLSNIEGLGKKVGEHLKLK